MVQAKEGIQHKSDIEVEDYHVWRELQIGDGTYKWFVSTGYVVLTVEGERTRRERTLELTGKQKTNGQDIRTWLIVTLKTEEGVT